MKSNSEDLRQYAIEEMSKINLRIRSTDPDETGDYDGIALEWTDKETKQQVYVKDIMSVRIEAVRIRRSSEIRYTLIIRPFKESVEILVVSKTAEEAFAVKDLVDDMIATFRERKSDGRSNV